VNAEEASSMDVYPFGSLDRQNTVVVVVPVKSIGDVTIFKAISIESILI
jgi:hypothetical protein